MIYSLIISVCCLYVVWQMWFCKKSSVKPPHLSGKLPFIGHVHQFYCNSRKMVQIIDKMSKESLKKGGVITVDLGIRQFYAIADPEDCLTISNTCLEKEKLYKIAKPLLGNGLIISSVPTWKKHRKLLNPAFSQPMLNSFVETFNSQARLLVELFAEELGKPFDHEKLLRLNNLETICLTATGLSEDFRYLQNQYLAQMTKLLNIFTERFQRVWLHSDFMFNMSKLKKEQDEIIKSMIQLSKTVITIKKAELQNYDKCSVNSKSDNFKSFMELLLNLANETGCFTDEEIREETDNILVAGHDTSGSILTYVFTLLGSHPDIQAKLYKEILEVFKNKDKNLDKDDLSKLIYTEAVLKETLRVYPIAPVIARYADKPVKLKKYIIEANSGCLLMLSGLNRHPMWGTDADQFKPERWLDTATLPDPNYFAGFGLGRRFCIGKVYAMMSMKIVVAHVISRYRISADVTKMVLKWEGMTRPDTGHEITLELRKVEK